MPSSRPDKARVSPRLKGAALSVGQDINVGLSRSSPPMLRSTGPHPPPPSDSRGATRSSLTDPAVEPVRTPSYPFPFLGTPRPLSSDLHSPFTALSPTVAPRPRSPNSQAAWRDEDDARQSVASIPVSSASSQSSPPATATPDARSSARFKESSLAFPPPALYDTILTLHAEPGLEQWWARVVQLAKDFFKANRLTLSVPADPTDLQNVPWGQKATFNTAEEDINSVVYYGPSAVAPASEASDNAGWEEDDPTPPAQTALRLPSSDTVPVRPKLESRHSFAGFERIKHPSAGPSGQASQRRPIPSRTRSYLANTPHTTEASFKEELPLSPAPRDHQQRSGLTSAAVQYNTEQTQSQQVFSPSIPDSAKRPPKARVVPVLQGLDYEAEPLIDGAGVNKVLERGRIVVLSREYLPSTYPSADDSSSDELRPQRASEPSTSPSLPTSGGFTSAAAFAATSSSREGWASDTRGLGSSPHMAGRCITQSPCRKSASSVFAGEPELSSYPSTAAQASKYEDFEQAPSSPWSQSPAPSPAIRSEPAENPFFAAASLDEDSFNPATIGYEDYSKSQQIEAIGVDRLNSIIHIPLIHPLLSHPVPNMSVPLLSNSPVDFAGESSTLSMSSPTQRLEGCHAGREDNRRTAIAILSMSCSLVPYPAHLIQSLEQLMPHLATSYSLAKHFTDVQSQAASLMSRYWRPNPSPRPPGGIDSGRRLEDDIAGLGLGHSASSPRSGAASAAESVTSPSEQSIGSTGGSLHGTPGWDVSSPGFSGGPRNSAGAPMPAPGSDDFNGYFATRIKQAPGRHDANMHAPSKELGADSPRPTTHHPSPDPRRRSSAESVAGATGATRHSVYMDGSTSLLHDKPEAIDRPVHDRSDSFQHQRVGKITGSRPSSPPLAATPAKTTVKNAAFTARARGSSRHSVLHSYGADFGSTFQSMPTAGGASIHPQAVTTPAGPRAGSRAPATVEMPPPSERLLRTMIDAMPVQIFTAAPQTGQITWVNSKFLAYRGHTVQDFIKNPWQSIHPEQRDDYLRVWTQSLRNGEQFSYRVRLRRFDGNYRWFYVRAAPLRDNKGITVHWFGTNMDIHDQHIAELNAARQKETAASESKYRALANSSPQIVFAATDAKGVIFVNTQWTHYSGQPFTDAAGLGFTNHVHPEDLVKCKLPAFRPKSELPDGARGEAGDETGASITSSSSSSNTSTSTGDTVVPQGRWRLQGEQAANRLQSPESSSPGERVPAFVESPENENGKFSTDVDGRPCYADELRLKSKDGEYRWHLVRCVMVDSSILGNGAASWFGTCTDINDHKLLEQKMKDTMESKTRFLSNMSHEIRTPLIGISGMVEFLYHTSLTAEQTDYCDTIWSSSTGLLSIVNDILDLSKIEAGMMSLSFDWFDIRSTIESVNDAVSAQAIKKGLELNYLVDDDVPPLVRGDQARIRQVLMNILGNAVKFTSAGEVFAYCHLTTDYEGSLSENEIVLSFEVIDSGEGFSEKEAELIFKPFSQIDATNTRQYGGSGLGLVISRQLVELHGGKMTGHSVPGKGSTFVFYAKFLTLEPPAAPIMRSDPSPEPLPNLPLRDLHSPYISRGFTQSPAAATSLSESDLSSPALASSASSEPSIQSARTFHTDRSSMSSVAPISVSRSDSESSGAQMKLVLPHASSTERSVPSAVAGAVPDRDKPATRTVSNPIAHPLLYSVLVVCPQPYSLRAITRHVEASLPRDIPRQVTSRASLLECQRMLGGDSPVIFTHIVLNVANPDQVMALMDQVFHSSSHTLTYIIALADAKSRQEIKRLARERGYSATENEHRVRFLHKPIKPSRLAEIFDPKLDRKSGNGGGRRGGEQQSGHRKQEFFEMEKMVGHRGHRVLLVEDNPINQKVVGMFLAKVGVEVEIVTDGVECTKRIFNHDHGFYSLVLCDLQMPNKDGYQTCKEIRQWEERLGVANMPVIALSANVIGDVLDRCVDAGFSTYLSKPVEFKALSQAMSELLDPSIPHSLMHRASAASAAAFGRAPRFNSSPSLSSPRSSFSSPQPLASPYSLSPPPSSSSPSSTRHRPLR